jgi:SAM-dependent methyltransferase
MSQMPDERVDYDEIAPVYDERYRANLLERVSAALMALARDIGARRILEAGCGTGRWLADFQAAGFEACGLDISLRMLAQAHRRDARLPLVCGRASRLPFQEASFDLVCCVNALHHFDDKRGFIFEARRLLRPGTYESDLRRFVRPETVMAWMTEAGFARTAQQVAERIVDPKTGREVLADTFLQKHATSQLVLLSDDAYAAGLRRIEAAIARAESAGETIVFPTDIALVMVTGHL